ncbi:MAG: DUF4258 domain-containing protein [Flavobacteriaceae bacterium]|nr:DUF4258 domain-containing protein [Flavobacteriaceae bacterium]
MNLIKRFIYYGIGLLLGSIFVYFIWEKKNVQFDYMPNARVLKTIRTDTRLFSDNATESMINIGIDTLDISDILKYGDVDFKKSSPRKKPCKIFVIDGNPKEKDITIVIKKCDSISTIDKVILN